LISVTLAAVAGLVAWEAIAGRAGGWGAARPWGYAAACAALAIAVVRLARRWRAPGPASRELATRLERLFPQARGFAREILGEAAPVGPDGGLIGKRRAEGRAWIARRGMRLDRALAAREAARARAARRLAFSSAALLAAALLAFPGSSRRAARAMADPGSLWRGERAWSVAPGNVRVPYGTAIAGRARFAGPAEERERIVLEWSENGDAWRADTLGPAPAAAWRWPPLVAGRAYRLRLGPHASAVYRIAVGAPLAVLEVEGRSPGGDWLPLAGRLVRAGERIEVRGRASDRLAAATVAREGEAGATLPLVGGRTRAEVLPLAIQGQRFTGAIVPSAGAWRVTLLAEDGRTASAASFQAIRPGEAFVVLLGPSDDPVHLGGASAWLEIRAGAPSGIGALAWQTDDGHGGAVGDPRGARDTTIAAVAPLAAGRAAGDTLRFRVIASPLVGEPVATPWRRAIVPAAGAIRERTAEARERALRAVERAVVAAEDAARDGRPAARAVAERGLDAAFDSLAAALERTLADPELGSETRDRLAAYHALLAGIRQADLGAETVLSRDPAAAGARAELLREIAAAVARAEAELARRAAVDSLSRLAVEQRALAQDTRSAGSDRERASIGPRQAEIARAARSAGERLSAESAERLDRALDRAEGEVASGAPEAAARAQEAAAGAMERVAEEARAAAAEDASRRAARLAAIDRAAGETSFLAERQRAAAERMTGVSTGAGETADRLARQQVVTQGLERTLAALVEGLGGIPASGETGRLLGEAVYATRVAAATLARDPGRTAESRVAAEAAARALALLARAFLVPDGQPRLAGAQGTGQSEALAQQLDAMADAQRSIAEARARAPETAGGDPEAAAVERQLGRDLGDLAGALEAEGIDRRAIEALVAAVEAAARRLEQGLPGARNETELNSLARRMADLGRVVERREGERRAETARAFVPADPPPLPARATARRLDPEAALAPWRGALPRPSLEPARRYLERLAEEGVRAPGEEER
jgi:hypothetical protein